MTKRTKQFFAAAAVALLVASPAFSGKKTTPNGPTPSAVAAAIEAVTGASGITVVQDASGDYIVNIPGRPSLRFSSEVVAYYMAAYTSA